jgi:hypothetical protein
MTAENDPELKRLLVNARRAQERYHRLAGFPPEVVAAAEALSKEAADAVDAYLERKRRDSYPCTEP